MADYNLQGLNHRDFEHLIQAIAKNVIASGVTPFGDGRDGAREATFKGRMDYPSISENWNGYLVVQCKYKQVLSPSASSDGQWALRQLEQEIQKYLSGERKLAKPEYYIFVTNVRLSAVSEVGTKDKLLKCLEDFASKSGIRGYDVWSYDEICRFIDNSSDIRKAFAGFITPGDVLSEVMSLLSLRKSDFGDVMGAFLQKELSFDQAAKLESAGQDYDHQISLARVFVDLPATVRQEDAQYFPLREYFGHRGVNMVETLLSAGSQVLRRSINSVGDSTQDDSRVSRFVIVGGPGQGKSTLGQYLCQLYRASIIKGLPSNRIDSNVSKVVQLLEQEQEAKGSQLPRVRRFPVRIVLNQYASDLARDSALSIVNYLRHEFSHLGGADCSVEDIKSWLKTYPWLVVFDGLDEVPASSNRKDVIRKIEEFRIDASNLDADLQIVCTTRPQSYNDDFPVDLFKHYYLMPLSTEQALEYAKKLVNVRCGMDEKRKDKIMRRLTLACDNDSTARLMQSPLQVTIMATLVDRFGEPPRERYRLFEQYYRTIYDREIGREGSLSAILSSRKTDIDAIHFRTGLLLQSENEKAGKTTSRLSDDRFRALVKARLKEVGEVDERLLNELADGSLERLVFLIRPTVGQVSFEIRSLQEFMAAEALLKGKDQVVIKRLQAIASIPYWRNVFLFAVGKCFADQEHLLDSIVMMCLKLNNSSEGLLEEQTLWGSRLALDILSEGVATQHPKYERVLADNALKILELPPSSVHIQLASVYHSGLYEPFRSAVVNRLSHPDKGTHFGTWAFLKALANRGVNWALEDFNNNWPTDTDTQINIILKTPNKDIQEWMLDKFIDVIPSCNPVDLHRLNDDEVGS